MYCQKSYKVSSEEVTNYLSNRWSQLRKLSRASALVAVLSTFDSMKPFWMLAALTATSGASALSR